MLKYYLSVIALLISFALSLSAQSAPDKQEDIYLIIASYNPDTKRMGNFIDSFEKETIKAGLHGRVLIEDLGCKDFGNESAFWVEDIKNLLHKYRGTKLKALILLGQEAWASFLDSDVVLGDVPVFVLFASKNGISLPNYSELNESLLYRETDVAASSKYYAGGFLNTYDVEANINLIMSLYPDTKNIAFVSDNTYGGVSLQAYVKKCMYRHPELDLILIDSRTSNNNEAISKINSLPPNSVILLGTWRVDKDGLYYLSGTINTLVEKRFDLPVFSLTTTGIGTIAIGGYVPKYYSSASEIVKQIRYFTDGQKDSVKFIYSGGEYQFNKEMLNRFDIREYRLPEGSVVISENSAQIERYRHYIYLISVVAVVLLFLIITLIVLYAKIRRLKINLERNKEELIIAKERAEESDRLKSAFLANMSHEIRTPLNAIVGFSNILTSDSLTVEERREYNSIIQKNSELLLSLINDILDISRLETGKAKFIFEEVDLSELCYSVMNTTMHLRKSGIEYRLEMEGEGVVIESDSNKLSQVLINLITNANKFTEQGRITLEYKISQDKKWVIFSVCDTGIGIPPGAAAKIFERFEKFNENKQGTGLGLAICRQIVKRLGGDIWVDESYKDGAKISFKHPVKR